MVYMLNTKPNTPISALAFLRQSLGVAPAPQAPQAPAPVGLVGKHNPLAHAVRAALATVQAQAPAPQAPAPRTTGRGAATLARWGRGNVTGKPTLGPASLNAGNLPNSTVITVLVKVNPKGGSSKNRFAATYNAAMQNGTTITVAAIAAIYASHAYGSKQMYADLAWDYNHGFIAW